MATNNTMNKLIFTLKALSDNATIRATQGSLILVLDDKNVSGIHTYKKLKKVTENFETENKAYISSAFSDYGVKKVIVVSGHSSETGITSSLDTILASMNKVCENAWVVAPQLTSETDKKKFCDFIKTQRSDENYPLKAVVYNYKAESEAIVNFTSTDLGINDTTSDQYCVDVACVLCTLSANESITAHVAKKVTSCDIKSDNDECVANGELFLYNDGTNIVFSRGVNSLTVIPSDQNDYLTKIRVIEVLDLIKTDLSLSFKENNIGRYGNSYSNRKSLVNVVNSYLRSMSKQGYLNNDTDSYCELDVEATRNYLESVKLENTDDMTDDEVLKAPIDSHVFLKITLYVMEIVEDISLNLYYTE
ncbi:phage tail sheath C-terminal domain-containing protein [Clostridium butyricum]|uniref:phage tail sheath C-terminal domain-containing protein n=1 Tax=Clostridium butyricum TaxID=1492 RepID=UPI00325B0928